MTLSNKREVREVVKTTLQPFVDDGSIELEDLKELVKSATDEMQFPISESNTKVQTLNLLLEFCKSNNISNDNDSSSTENANSLVTRVTEAIKVLEGVIANYENKVEKPALTSDSDVINTASAPAEVTSSPAIFANNTLETSVQQSNNATSSFSISALRARLAQRKRELESEDAQKQNDEIVKSSALPQFVSKYTDAIDDYTITQKYNNCTLPETEKEKKELTYKNGNCYNHDNGNNIDVPPYDTMSKNDKDASKVVHLEDNADTNSMHSSSNDDNSNYSSKKKMLDSSGCNREWDNKSNKWHADKSVCERDAISTNLSKRNREESSYSISQTVKKSRNANTLKTSSLFAAHDNGNDDNEDIDAALYSNITFAAQRPVLPQMHDVGSNNNNNFNNITKHYQRPFHEYNNEYNHYYYNNNNKNNNNNNYNRTYEYSHSQYGNNEQ